MKFKNITSAIGLCYHFFVKKLIKNLFQTKWEIIYSTQNIEKYAKVKGNHILVRLEDVHKASEVLNSTK